MKTHHGLARSGLLFLLLLATALTGRATDLLPLDETFTLEGATFHNVRFRGKNGSGGFVFTPPWKLSGSGNQVNFTIPEPLASGFLRITSISAEEATALRTVQGCAKWIETHRPESWERFEVTKI